MMASTISGCLLVYLPRCAELQRYILHLAAWSGKAEVVSFLCKNKADVGASAVDDMAAIHFAAQKGHLEVVKTLVSCGVSVKVFNRKECEKQIEIGDTSEKQTAEEVDEKLKGVEKEKVLSVHEERGEGKDESVKRKGEEETAEGSFVRAKKTKVALNHLLTSDDTHEDEE